VLGLAGLSWELYRLGSEPEDEDDDYSLSMALRAASSPSRAK
jgi:hypothetical protein